jgi:hypothetical protein
VGSGALNPKGAGPVGPAPSHVCARHGRRLGGASPLRGVVPQTASRRQGRHREVGSGGSPRQSLGPRHTNLVIRPSRPDERARYREVHGTKGLGGAPGGREVKVCVLTRGDLLAVGSTDNSRREAAAEPGEVSRGRSTRGPYSRREGPNVSQGGKGVRLVEIVPTAETAIWRICPGGRGEAPRA